MPSFSLCFPIAFLLCLSFIQPAHAVAMSYHDIKVRTRSPLFFAGFCTGLKTMLWINLWITQASPAAQYPTKQKAACVRIPGNSLRFARCVHRTARLRRPFRTTCNLKLLCALCPDLHAISDCTKKDCRRSDSLLNSMEFFYKRPACITPAWSCSQRRASCCRSSAAGSDGTGRTSEQPSGTERS